MSGGTGKTRPKPVEPNEQSDTKSEKKAKDKKIKNKSCHTQK